MDFQPMSPEERERMMQFLLNQQAQFAADCARIEANVESLSVKTDRIAEGLVGLTSVVGQLAASQLQTDQQLKSLIQTFEHHLRDDHSRPPS